LTWRLNVSLAILSRCCRPVDCQNDAPSSSSRPWAAAMRSMSARTAAVNWLAPGPASRPCCSGGDDASSLLSCSSASLDFTAIAPRVRRPGRVCEFAGAEDEAKHSFGPTTLQPYTALEGLRDEYFSLSVERNSFRVLAASERAAGRRSRHSRLGCRARSALAPACRKPGSAHSRAAYKQSAPAVLPW